MYLRLFYFKFEQTFVHLKGNVTITDISRESKVSVSTVSRVLNGLSRQYRISKETEDTVMKIARKLHYRPNLTAVNLRRKKSNTIGLLVPTLFNPFFSNIASIVNHELRKNGYSVILMDCGEDEKTELEVLEFLVDRRIDGLLVMPSGHDCPHLDALYTKGMPMVCIDRYFESSAIPFVSTNNFQGAYELTKYLVSCGHKRIACIQGVNYVMPNKQRVAGYTAALADAGLPVYYIGGQDFSEENGYLETKLLLQQQVKPTAIFGLSDTIILGAIKALKEEGMTVPDDVSLATFDNALYLDYLAPALTSVVQPVAEIAQIAIRILLERMSGEPEGKRQQEKILLSPRIIHRASVREI
ncbi:LacI family DNA-binding transcriptional regulator [Chitinophaga sp. MM2321]|uniref:LacI family DNA-binding transcriptional regulator n=1 Tax=Chitinophaga sp. MM2321 TaxID=3137178 RepID=UPI0032D570AD